MNNYRISQVNTKGDRKKFLDMAADLYRGDKNWVRPWNHDIESVFDPKKNKMFDGGEAARWILLDNNDRVVGRIAAFYNRRSAEMEAQPTGGCGFFECINDQAAANLLFDTAKEWLMGKGMQAMDGSINFGDRMMWWGVLVEGFELPIYGMNYNFPYYGELFENYGFKNYFNQHSFNRRLLNYEPMEPALYEKAQRLYENPDYSFECIDMSRLEDMADNFRSIYNSAWAKFPGVNPLTKEHAMEQMNAMKDIIDPEVLYFAYHKGQPVGFFLMIPDINIIVQKLNGKFGLWQKLIFLYNFKFRKIQNRISGLTFGVAAEFQGRGVEAGMIRQFEQYTIDRRNAGKIQYQNLDMAWVGDFNPVMIRMCESQIKAERNKRHVTYRYLFDREKPFTRAPRLGKTVKGA